MRSGRYGAVRQYRRYGLGLPGTGLSALAPEVAYFHQRRRYPAKQASPGEPGDPTRVEGRRSGALGAQQKLAQGLPGDRGSPGEARPSFVVEWELADGTTRGLSHVLHLDPQVPHLYCSIH